jgi:outer membrane immunogenic protein
LFAKAAAHAVDELEETSMKQIFGGIIVAVALSGSAFAADLGPRSYSKAAAMPAPPATWSGLYLGGTVGYGWGNGNTDFVGLPNTADY